MDQSSALGGGAHRRAGRRIGDIVLTQGRWRERARRSRFHRRHAPRPIGKRSEEHTSELQSLMRISYAVFCLKKKKTKMHKQHHSVNSPNIKNISLKRVIVEK